VEVALTAPVKIVGGAAELLDSSGVAVSSAAVKASGKKVTADLSAGSGVAAGYYVVRVSLTGVDGKQYVEETQIGIVKQR